MSLIIEGQRASLARDLTPTYPRRDAGLPVGVERFEASRGGPGLRSARQYLETNRSRLPSTVAWRAGMDTPRDHHVPRHGHRR